MVARCSNCPAKDARTVAPDSVGPGTRLVLIGDGPSNSDLGEGRLGATAGYQQMLRDLRHAGIPPASVHITNATLCKPKSGQLEACRKACAGRLHAELAQAVKTATGERARLLVSPLGSLALQTVLRSKKTTSLFKWRGFVHVDPSTGAGDGWLVVPTLAPWLVWSLPKWRPAQAADIARLGRLHAARGDWQPPEALEGREALVCRTVSELRAALKRLGPIVSFDVETVGLGPTETALTCFGLSDGKLSICVPWSRDLAGAAKWWTRPADIARMVTKACSTRTVITHNGPAFDHVVAARYGLHFPIWEDTLNMMHALDGHLPKGLAYLVGTALDAPPWKQAPHSDNVQQLWGYNLQDVLYTRLAYDALPPRLAAEGMAEVYRSDKAMALVCRDMQVNGFDFDEEKATEFVEALHAKEAAAIAQCAQAVGRSVNPFSPKDLGKAFTRDLLAPVYLRSEKTGAASFGIQALRAYAASADEKLQGLALGVIAARSARKVRVTYIVNVTRGRDGRVHPSWLSYGTVTGRFACQAPNLANLPRAENDPTRELGGIRSLYRAREGHKIVYFDVKQIEMRMAAYASGDEAMIAACEAEDMHAANATLVFGDEFTSAEPKLRSTLRSIIKSAGFAICYLAEEETVYLRIKQTGTNISMRQVSAMMRKMRQSFAHYYRWQAANLQGVVKTGYVYAPISGRRRWLGHDPRPTECANFPIQSGAAGLMNNRLEVIAAALAAEQPGAKLVAQVYDSVCIEAPADSAEAVAALCKREFEKPITVNGRNAVFPIDMEITDRWH
jgi:DNA polymerase I-like protein with 3'-5' exonuclease and polymerase domains